MTPLPNYEIYAIKYAEHHRMSKDNFLGGDAHDHPMPLDYYIWVIRHERQVWVFDTGFSPEEAKSRGRDFKRCPSEGLRALGIDPDAVTDVIISHMHYDHCGNNQLFQKAKFHLQEREMQFATGKCMCHKSMRYPFTLSDVLTMVERVHTDRAVFHDDAEEINPGLSVHHVGGHTAGLQILRVHTARGWVVLASDASHFYANMENQRPFPIIHNTVDMLEGYKTCYRLASSTEHVIPGHDPLVMARYPSPSPELEGWIARLDAVPKTMST